MFRTLLSLRPTDAAHPLTHGTNMHALKLLAIVIPAFLVFDLLWLGVIMKGFYMQELGDLARRDGTTLSPRWGAAILVYLLIPLGVVLFVRPALAGSSSLWVAFAWGAVFGLVLYGVYDLTNRSILEKWSLRMTVADILWGTLLCGTTALIMQVADRWLKP
jgi:uncharacterized membrane protein